VEGTPRSSSFHAGSWAPTPLAQRTRLPLGWLNPHAWRRGGGAAGNRGGAAGTRGGFLRPAGARWEPRVAAKGFGGPWGAAGGRWGQWGAADAAGARWGRCGALGNIILYRPFQNINSHYIFV
jgi:hypothetical protein